MASAVNYLEAQPMSFDEYWRTFDGAATGIKDPNSFGAKTYDFFTGKVTSAKQNYENYLSDFEFKRNQAAAAQANAATFEREDSQTQRLVDDYQKAGLNPYLVLSGGNLSSGVVSSASQYATHKRQQKASFQEDNKLLSSALKILALLILKKA